MSHEKGEWWWPAAGVGESGHYCSAGIKVQFYKMTSGLGTGDGGGCRHEHVTTAEPHACISMRARDPTCKTILNIPNFRRCELKYLEASAIVPASNFVNGSGEDVFTHTHTYGESTDDRMLTADSRWLVISTHRPCLSTSLYV